jgi:HK97 family phage prohead protease
MTETETDSEPVEIRTEDGKEECSTCEGSGKIKGGSTDCPDCNGTGEVQPSENNAADDPSLEQRKHVREIINGTVERRDFAASDVEIRSTSDGGLRFTGYASTTETPYMVGSFEETFARGAFKRCLGEDPDVVLLINHAGIPLARTRSGTLTLSEDTRGLRVDAQLDPENPTVQTLVSPMKRGDLTEMSFAFRATDDEWSDSDRKRVVRAATIHKGDVSMVTHGANTDTTGMVTMRSENGDLELRVGKELSKAKEAKIKGALEKMSELGDDLAELLPEEPDLPPVTPWQANKQEVDHTTRAKQEYDYLKRKAQEEGE